MFENGVLIPGDKCYKIEGMTPDNPGELCHGLKWADVEPVWTKPGLAYDPYVDATCVNDGKTSAPYDTIANPPHYARHAIQPIEFIMTNKLAYAVGNVIKYVCRYDAKGGMEDLMKARNYLDILIEDYKKDKP
jgi:hypothetical protein